MQGTTDILGHEQTIERLWQSAAQETLHHAYLFEGPKGVGKSTLARRFAMAVNCTSEEATGPASSPCGQCPSCVQILAGNHPDVITLQPDPEKAAQIISVDALSLIHI